MDDLLEFAYRLIEENDGAVEWRDSRDGFEALLPEEIQTRLGLPEPLVVISNGISAGGGPGGIPIGFGTELLDRAIPMAMETGRSAAVRMPVPSARRQADLDPSASFSFPNAAFRPKGDHESWLDYWVWSFDVFADADERREEVHHICVSSVGAGCLGLAEIILDQASAWEPLNVRPSEFSEKTLDGLFAVACDRVLRQVDERLAGFKETVMRHHGRDIRRIERYFQDMRAEMEQEIERRQLTGEELEIRREKMAQLEREESSKLAALKEKYRLRLTLRPVALLLARLPVRRCDILVKRRKGDRQLSLVYNTLTKAFDPMVCEACGADTWTPGFCDEALHILCPACASAFSAQKTCPRCQGKAPPSKMEGVLKRLGIEASKQREN
jgi:hypothetical protein